MVRGKMLLKAVKFMRFNEKIQKLRKDRGISQEKLAEVIGVSRQSVAKWELGKAYPEVDKLIMLSNYFGVSIDRLLKNLEDECGKPIETFSEILVEEDIIGFLCEAKKNTYAASSNKKESSRPNSHDLSYQKGKFKYIDTYLGSERFSGEEGIWIDDSPYWAMNYTGRVIGEEFSDSFLKEALSLVPRDNPYRGPIMYQNGGYSYHCLVNGEFEWFNGYEAIYYRDNKIYECIFHGGIVIN